MKENPMSTEQVNKMARHLMEPVPGPEQVEGVIKYVNELEDVENVREILPFLVCEEQVENNDQFSIIRPVISL